MYYSLDSMISFNSYLNEECIVYLESFKKSEQGFYEKAYIDFRTIRDRNIFNKVIFGGVDKLNNGKVIDIATIIELSGLKTSKRLVRGSYYKLNLQLLQGYNIELNNDSLIIGAHYNLRNMPIPNNDDNELLQRHSPVLPSTNYFSTSTPIESGLVKTERINKVKVQNVGQANWNELLYDDKIVILFDAGAELRAKKKEVQDFISSKEQVLKSSKPILIISHWDLDHVHCLKMLDEHLVSKYFSILICPNRIKSLTYSNIILTFKNALGGDKVFAMTPPRKGTELPKRLKLSNSIFSLYIGEASRNINYCGLILYVKGERMSCNLTGDCRLSQAKEIYDYEKPKSNHHFLIAPHHGGDCGINYRQYSLPCDLIAISVGDSNPYGHPQKDMLKYLKGMGKVKQTNIDGDIIQEI